VNTAAVLLQNASSLLPPGSFPVGEVQEGGSGGLRYVAQRWRRPDGSVTMVTAMHPGAAQLERVAAPVPAPVIRRPVTVTTPGPGATASGPAPVASALPGQTPTLQSVVAGGGGLPVPQPLGDTQHPGGVRCLSRRCPLKGTSFAGATTPPAGGVEGSSAALGPATGTETATAPRAALVVVALVVLLFLLR